MRETTFWNPSSSASGKTYSILFFCGSSGRVHIYWKVISLDLPVYSRISMKFLQIVLRLCQIPDRCHENITQGIDSELLQNRYPGRIFFQKSLIRKNQGYAQFLWCYLNSEALVAIYWYIIINGNKHGILLNCTAFVFVHFKHKEMFPCCFDTLKMVGWCIAMPVYPFSSIWSHATRLVSRDD